MMYDLKQIIQKYELNAKKSLGQNFILDENLLVKIAKLSLAGVKHNQVLEVGPGPGGLTKALLEQGDFPITAIEKDDRCAKALAELSSEFPNRLTVLNEDALTFDESSLGKDICVVANLPYNVSTVLLVKWLQKIDLFSGLTLMFQKEVADRLTAKENDEAYGRLSVLTGWLTDVSMLMILPPSVFTPAPKVTSALVRLTPKKERQTGFSFDTMSKLTQAAFSQRRKMLRSSLKTLGLSSDEIEQICVVAGIESNLRAEQVSVDAFCKMAGWLERKKCR
ncbi:MAG: 16S rRNA (adenine(1518)-N(6)/adenine(1519)-N(6))-dimethyltransferase RsmA [Alphaproteobacteria bacterium]|nr:16S rRNA (adenine(1518)-N(6)/adenine(1519)-N(6))-dimethyltransferase RsmA [Alphaproteobacteria bacterium]